MSERYRCLTARRLEKLVASSFNGIDYLEVDASQARFDIVFVKSAGVGGLSKEDLKLSGGIRYPAPEIETAVVSAVAPNTLQVALKANPLTDFSTYTLTLVSPTGATPPGFDPESANVQFSFKINCPSPFDCAEEGTRNEQSPAADPDLDYTARDWAGFRQLMLDRISTLLPGFTDDTPVDPLVTYVETLAYVADHLSYRLDAIANDSDFFRARSRIAMARHARLVDYPVHEGCNARLFAHITYSGKDGVKLERSTPLTISSSLRGVTVSPDDFASIAVFEPLTFETMHDIALYAGNNRFEFHTWSGERCVLRRGSTRATVRRAIGTSSPKGVLAPGDFLVLLETLSPETGIEADADRLKRHAVRLTSVHPSSDVVEGIEVFEVAWDLADALPFELTISTEFANAGATPRIIVCAQAWGNIVLADHGLTLPVRHLSAITTRQALTPRLEPPVPFSTGRWRPLLTRGPVVRSAPLDLSPGAQVAASLCLRNDPTQALPVLTLNDNFKPWLSRHDLLASERFDRHFVVETQSDGNVWLRFGDDVMGQKPTPGDRLSVTARIGRHSEGNIGADVLRQVVSTVAGIDAVSNPLPGQGGQASIGATRVWIEAPHAFRTQERAVTEADYEEVAVRHPEVASARAKVRWTGSWRTCFLYIDRVGGGPVESDTRLRAQLMRHMERYRLCGIDIALKDAIAVPLDMTLRICLTPGALRANVRRNLLELLGSGLLADGRRGFFHPDGFTFGTALYLSKVIATVMSISGVASAEITELRRRGKSADGVLDRGVIEPRDFEILRLDNDPNFPENGLLTLDLKGGK